ncbi:ribose-phosphate pyrophosphokinase-like domain-containing protein [Nocardia arthritidis]|uniref:ribose-phosphate diphosphokinase n=1 Tax=Nocardia arthritidis TaxID=228602 RepID=A0A6G9YN32_9NOCA|nr:ribose-phosphate pyrophosphokinase-like domain-containing protein [Nocardia arthritidis]QIS14446.1 hypothetical protein F5544_33045 [Nocardia arthritidis]
MNSLHIVSGSANPGLAAAIADRLEAGPVAGALERFPDGELCPVVEHVGGADVFVIQPTSPPVNDHLVELLLPAAQRSAGRPAAHHRVSRPYRICRAHG